jgi:hypothetical protein
MTTALPDFVSEISGMMVTLLPVAALGPLCSRVCDCVGKEASTTTRVGASSSGCSGERSC